MIKKKIQAELGVPHSRSKFSGPNQNCCQTSGLVLWLWVDFVLPLSQEEEEEFSKKKRGLKKLFGPKIFFWSNKKFWSEKKFVSKNNLSENYFGPK